VQNGIAVADPVLRSFLSTGSLRQRARWLLRFVTPWAIEWWLYTRGQPRRVAKRAELDARIVREPPPEPQRVEEAVQFLLRRGLNEEQVRGGSMPGEALRYTREVIFERLPDDRPVRALHIGNFVGVSLCYFSWLVCERHPESVVVSVDPNIEHRGIIDAESHVLALLHRFGQVENNLLLRGYTLGCSDDWALADDYEGRIACEGVLHSLESLGAGTFDLVVIDGTHEENYLKREVAALRRLLADDAIVVLDDVQDWPGVAAVFRQMAQEDSFQELHQDGRVGILQRRSPRRFDPRSDKCGKT
jgi:hypothetical protein